MLAIQFLLLSNLSTPVECTSTCVVSAKGCSELVRGTVSRYLTLLNWTWFETVTALE